MEIQAHTLVIPKTAHYYTLGQAGPHIRYLWLACHGYGQSAGRFILKFDAVARPDTFIVAPEGLSRFYWQGFDGDIVASWMTRQDRLHEIADYANYLQTLLDSLLLQLPSDTRIVLMGFSQGCATQMRWIMRNFPRFDHLILWAGTIPEDLDYRPHEAFFAARQLHYVYGTEDPFLTPERIAQAEELMTEQGLDFQVHTFNGKHTVDRQTLARVAALIRGEK